MDAPVDLLLDDFAIRCFRDTGDQDYIAARLAHRARLYPQFLWMSLQAVEKYLKAILLINRIPSKRVGHELGAALCLIDDAAKFSIRLSPAADEFIRFLDTYGRFRYLETSWHVRWTDLHLLDLAVWEIRRYCRRLDYEIRKIDGTAREALSMELQGIESAEGRPPQHFRIIGGFLERVIADRDHPARQGLLWKNLRYGVRHRTRVRFSPHRQDVNSPLAMRPELLDHVLKYVHLPKDVVGAFREEARQRRQARV